MTATDCTAGLNKGCSGRHQPRLPQLLLEWHRRHDDEALISVQMQHARL